MSEHTPAPRENNGTAIRALPALEFRAASDGGDGIGSEYLGLLRILFSPVNEWTEINSMFEGRFLERFVSGAWKKTIRERAERIRSLFQHGMDPQIGDKPLGPFRTLEEGDSGGYAEVKLLDTSYNRDLLPGLREGLYGASHRFSVVREEVVENPEPSEHNPHGLQERTVKEAKLMELGPVTFPAYEGATAGVRSMTDDFLMRAFDADPARVRAMFEQAHDFGVRSEDATPEPDAEERQDSDPQDAPSSTEAAPQEGTSGPERRDPRRKGRYGLAKTDPRPSWAL